MTVVSSRARILIHEAGFYAAFFVVVLLSAAQWIYASADAPDWQGYQALYEGSADWLSPNGLAPLFVAFLDGARWVFGSEGYGLFRLALFAVFAGFACWLAYLMPLQPRLKNLSALMTGATVVTALLLKSVVQIREGLAFTVMLVGILAMSNHGVLHVARSCVIVMVAPMVHTGVIALSATWLIAIIITWLPWKLLERRWLHRTVAFSALATGLCVGLVVFENGRAIAAYVSGLGVDTSAIARGGAYKTAYWAALGLVVFVLGQQVIGAGGKLAFAFSVTLGKGFLPFAYGFCVFLVASSFETPAITSLGIRVLFTGLDLSLIMICLRGRANWLTAVAMVLMLIDELRLLAAT